MNRLATCSALGAAVTALLILSFAAQATPALAAAPALSVNLHREPSNFAAGGVGRYSVEVSNDGDAPTTGPVEVEVELPAGITSRLSTNLYPFPAFGKTIGGEGWTCPTGTTAGETTVSCTYAGSLDAGASGPSYLQTNPALILSVDIDAGVSGTPVAQARATGGGAARAGQDSEPTPISDQSVPFGIASGSYFADAFDASSSPERQAGAHPFRATLSFDLNLIEKRNPEPLFDRFSAPVDDLRNVEVRLPRGLVGNPQAAPQCRPADFAIARGIAAQGTDCPTDSQVGSVDLDLFQGIQGSSRVRAPVYNLAPSRGALAMFGLSIVGNPAVVTASLDPVDHRIVTRVSHINEAVRLRGQTLSLWGVPGDRAHDASRFDPAKPGPQNTIGSFGAASSGSPRPFLSLPSQCGVDDVTTIRVASWQNSSIVTPPLDSIPARLTGCNQLRFTPSVTVRPTATGPDAPTGLDVALGFPQDTNGLGTPPLRNAKVTLPEGMTVNPAAADGLQACSDGELGLKTDRPVGCPEGAKIGTVSVETPVLANPVAGSVFIRSQNSDDPQSGEMFRLAIVLEDKERGLLVKLPGSVKADPVTGRLTATFLDNPQLPVEKISLRLKSGARAPLATPPTCGPKTTQATLSSWGGQVSDLSDSFTISCPASNVLSPSFKAGSVDPRAGVFSPFVANIARLDGQAYINGLSMELAPGMLAKLKGLPVCSDAAAAAGTCAASSRIGTATVGAGSGAPFYLKGGMYLTGPYKGAPYGLAVKVRAAAGPFDLGDVIVRQALYVDRTDAHVTVVSDPLPTIVKGVPVRLRSIDVNIDRPGFTSTPTSCAAKDIASTFSSPDGQTISLRSPYRVGECAALDLKPSLTLSLSGKGQTTDGKHPAVTANLVQQPGQSNLKKVRVALPLSLALDPDNANGLCEFADGSKPEPTCPKASIVGTATATTPILDQPLTGPVYFVKNIRKDPKSGREIRTLPKLVIPLTGQNGLRLNLTGTSNVEDDHLVTTFDNLPDAPVSSFKMNINGGKGGILVVSGDKADICKSTQIADQQIDGHNNKQADAGVSIQTPSCPLKVISKKTTKTSVAVKVGGLGAGKVTITGRGIKKTTKTITKSTVATITAKRTKAKPGKVTISFDPAGPAKARKTSK